MSQADTSFCQQIAGITHRKKLATTRKNSIQQLIRSGDQPSPTSTK